MKKPINSYEVNSNSNSKTNHIRAYCKLLLLLLLLLLPYSSDVDDDDDEQGDERRAADPGRCIRAPIRALGRAATFTAVAARSRRGSRSHGYGSAGDGGRDEDFGELVRAASRRAEAERAAAAAAAAEGPKRSRSVAAIGRIDEDRECEFGGGGVGEGNCKLGVGMRSRSCAVGSSMSRTGRVGDSLNF
uniref:Uncharacterized protein n=1 Tax=Ananas comosus var. bracteatus TaxID=296719 RepID=A0A6V7NUZ1_ANACO|nr:unnamed protein product [Ananas comosus var. bracteatus]